MDEYEVDFVVLWVDPNDPQWQAEKKNYSPKATDDVQIIRYQDWANFKYWFRAVAEYAPWVRKIHLVTCGQVPAWLDINHPKINLVKHSDYMPLNALPTFNSNAIEIGIQNIKGLAEQFVLFNDDMFITSSINKDYFIMMGLPVDMPGFIKPARKEGGNAFASALVNNARVIYKYFDKKEILKKRTASWFNPAYGKTFLRNIFFSVQTVFPGFVMPHLSTAYLKSDFEKVWAREEQVLRATQYHRFRSEEDVTHFLIRNWRMCEGAFYPRKSRGRYFSIDGKKTAIAAAKAIKYGKYPEICINETCSGEMFNEVKEIINKAFAEKFSKRCEFERPCNIED